MAQGLLVFGGVLSMASLSPLLYSLQPMNISTNTQVDSTILEDNPSSILKNNNNNVDILYNLEDNYPWIGVLIVLSVAFLFEVIAASSYFWGFIGSFSGDHNKILPSSIANMTVNNTDEKNKKKVINNYLFFFVMCFT